MSMTKLSRVVALLASSSIVLAACGGDDAPSSQSSFKKGKADIAGQEITALMPYKVPKALLDEFTAETGVKVKYNVAGWEAVASKLVVAHQAGTYIADVTDFDWSFTGQFGGNGWYEPLQTVLPKKVIKDLGNLNASFTTGGNLYAGCYNNDFRLSMYNDKQFASAGLSGFPETFDDLRSDLAQLKKSGVAAPMTMPLGATEGSVTVWYLLTLAMGGELFDEDFKPVFNDPSSAGYKALEFQIEALKKGWVSPGSVTLDGEAAFQPFLAGASAANLASSPTELVQADDPGQSEVVGNAKPALVPGIDGPGPTFGLQEGLGIPVTAKRKDAAAAFVEWWMRPDVQVKMYKAAEFLPCSKEALDTLAASGELKGGEVLTEELGHVRPLFPQGAPEWYSNFSSEARGLLNAAFKGEMSPQEALDQLADIATELAQSS
jgi:multiple sugar transport system substrate-binding protein